MILLKFNTRGRIAGWKFFFPKKYIPGKNFIAGPPVISAAVGNSQVIAGKNRARVVSPFMAGRIYERAWTLVLSSIDENRSMSYATFAGLFFLPGRNAALRRESTARGRKIRMSHKKSDRYKTAGDESLIQQIIDYPALIPGQVGRLRKSDGYIYFAFFAPFPLVYSFAILLRLPGRVEGPFFWRFEIS